MMTFIEYLDNNHPLQHIGMRGALIHAQRAIVSRAFPTAADFCARVLADMQVSAPTPPEFRDQPAPGSCGLGNVGARSFGALFSKA